MGQGFKQHKRTLMNSIYILLITELQPELQPVFTLALARTETFITTAHTHKGLGLYFFFFTILMC